MWDEDKTGNDIVGSIPLQVKEIMGEDNGLYKWINVYGAHLGFSGDVTDEFNEEPEKAPCWKGRILVQLVCEPNDNPKTESKILYIVDKQILSGAQQFMTHQQYDIIAEVS